MDYALKDLVTKIGQTESNRVEMSGLVDALIRLSGKTYPAKLHLTFDAVPEYNAQEGALYLKNLRILRWSGEPNSAMDATPRRYAAIKRWCCRLIKSDAGLHLG